MSVVQLTFIVAVNMMGSGIIMLPANMAQVGAISLLSWIVTAVGSMAIASFASGAMLSRFGWSTVNEVVFPVILIAAFFLAWGLLVRRPETV